MKDRAVLTILLASQMSKGAMAEPGSHCMPTDPAVAKIAPEGAAGSVPPTGRVDAFGLESRTPPHPHPQHPWRGESMRKPTKWFSWTLFGGCDHSIVVINGRLPSA